MSIGIVKGDVVPPNTTSYAWSGSYGWSLGSNVAVWKEGSGTIEASNQTKQGDEVELILNCDEAKLSLHLTTGQQFHIDIPKNKTWRLNIDMFSANDKIRIVNA